MKTRYVLMYIFNEDNSKVVGLIKKKGFDFLINKITVPGGKSKLGENIFETATRETKEECSLIVTDWNLLDSIETKDYHYHTVYSIGNDISKAKQMEFEPVFIMDANEHINLCKENPQLYNPDFPKHMEKLTHILKKNLVKKLKF